MGVAHNCGPGSLCRLRANPADTLETTFKLWQVVSEQHGKDDAVLLRLLIPPEVMTSLAERGPLAPARLRRLEVRATEILGVSRLVIDKRGVPLSLPSARQPLLVGGVLVSPYRFNDSDGERVGGDSLCQASTSKW